jgi:hypothetical protein
LAVSFILFIFWSGLGQDSEKEDDGLVYDDSLLRLEMNEASDINEGGMSSATNGTYVVEISPSRDWLKRLDLSSVLVPDILVWIRIHGSMPLD